MRIENNKLINEAAYDIDKEAEIALMKDNGLIREKLKVLGQEALLTVIGQEKEKHDMVLWALLSIRDYWLGRTTNGDFSNNRTVANHKKEQRNAQRKLRNSGGSL